MTRAYNTATTQQNSGGAVAGVTAGKNAIINGGMDIWQRGTSFTSASVYTADRWFKGSQPSWTTSRQTSGLTGFQYAMRFQRDSGNTSTVGCQMFYNLETTDALRFAGQTVTVSFYARAGANFSANSSQFSYTVYTGTGTDQRRDQSTGYTGEAQAANSSITLTTSWQRFQFTASIGSTATEIAIALGYTPVGTAGAADFAEITGVQLEVGSVATPFSRAGGTIQGELAACQRYYWRNQSTSGFVVGDYYTSTRFFGYYKFPTTMRINPSFAASGTTIATVYSNGSGRASTNVIVGDISQDFGGVEFVTAAATAGNGGHVVCSTAGSYLEWSAEL